MVPLRTVLECLRSKLAAFSWKDDSRLPCPLRSTDLTLMTFSWEIFQIPSLQKFLENNKHPKEKYSSRYRSNLSSALSAYFDNIRFRFCECLRRNGRNLKVVNGKKSLRIICRFNEIRNFDAWLFVCVILIFKVKNLPGDSCYDLRTALNSNHGTTDSIFHSYRILCGSSIRRSMFL